MPNGVYLRLTKRGDIKLIDSTCQDRELRVVYIAKNDIERAN